MNLRMAQAAYGAKMKLRSFGVRTCGHGRELAVHDLPDVNPSADPLIHRRFDLPTNGWLNAVSHGAILTALAKDAARVI
jgi:hypothetical protein